MIWFASYVFSKIEFLSMPMVSTAALALTHGKISIMSIRTSPSGLTNSSIDQHISFKKVPTMVSKPQEIHDKIINRDVKTVTMMSNFH